MEEWLSCRDSYLRELLRHDGRGEHDATSCADCGNSGDFSCFDCAYGMHYCQECLVDHHRLMPLHRISICLFYEKTSLQELGLVIQLGHRGPSCPCPGLVQKDFVIVDVSGIHTIDVQFCGCHNTSGGSASHVQLLRFRCFSSTITRPQSAFTFDVLNTFHLLTLQGKVSAYEFYCALQHKTDNTSISDTKGYYRQFLTVVRLWRHLKLLKRSGRGHDPAGANGTQPGQCAVECPACPHPNRNIPPDWINAPDSRRWLYSLNLTIDANFRLKNKARGIENDSPLGDGWGHWVPNKPYQEYIQKHGYEKEPNLCDSELHAVDHANTRVSQGYTTTGVGGVVCARHGLVRKNGMGNLQKGERYANMDFILFNSLIDSKNDLLVFSYDIACQWSRNLSRRLVQLPNSMRLSDKQLHLLRFAIPKFHISAHGLDCQSNFSFNFQPYMARTDGEDPERWWAHINPVSMSTKEMGPGARLDTLDDHAGAWNWRKITGFGTGLSDMLKGAIMMSQRQQKNHDEFTAIFPSDTIRKWQNMVEDWNANRKAPNPYVEPVASTSIASLRLEIAKEEAASTETTGADQPHDMTPSLLIQNGLDLEEQQWVLVQQASRAHTPNECADLEEQRNVLCRRLNIWMDARNLYYIPLISEDHAAISPAESSHPQTMPVGHLPETMPLTLPSALPASLQNSGPFKLAQIELRFRLAHTEDSLSELRRLLRITMGLRDYKVKQIGPSQRAGTRARNLINRFKDKLSRCAERYRAARNALLALDPMGEWGKRLQELKNEHIRAPGRSDGESEGFRQVSWIWMVARRCTPGQVSSPQQLQPLSLRCEWVKSKARADRWNEEVQLVKEEMRRVLAFLEWKAVWWTEEGGGKLGVTPDIADGIRAYAAKQASINRKLAQSFEMHWKSGVKTQDRDRDREQDLEQDNLTDDCEYTGEADKYTAGAEFDTGVD
ncbi:hypothetical protein V8E52_011131 [Russula decolorans]